MTWELISDGRLIPESILMFCVRCYDLLIFGRGRGKPVAFVLYSKVSKRPRKMCLSPFNHFNEREDSPSFTPNEITSGFVSYEFNCPEKISRNRFALIFLHKWSVVRQRDSALSRFMINSGFVNNQVHAP